MAKTICTYAATGCFKTSQVKWFARYIAAKTGKATLLLSTDGGGWEPCEPEIRAGMIRAWQCETANTPLSLINKVSKGFWPADVEKINEAIARMFVSREIDPAANMVPIDWNEIGGIAVEGLTSIGQVVMRYLPDKGQAVGGENRSGPNMQFTAPVVIDGAVVNETFGSNTRGDYGFVQNLLYGLVSNFKSLPCHTVMFTALESKTTEDGEKMSTPVYGPDMPGKKATAQCGNWFGDLLHGQDYAVPRVVEVPDPADREKKISQTVVDVKVRYFYRKHPDPGNGVMFPAKPRCAPEKIAELEKVFPGGFFEPTTEWGIDRYMDTVDRLAEDASQGDVLAAWRAKQDQKLGRK